MARRVITPKSAESVKRFESIVSGIRDDFLTCGDTESYLNALQNFGQQPFVNTKTAKVSGKGSFYGRLRKALEKRFGHDHGVITPLDYQDWGFDIGTEIPDCPLSIKDIAKETRFEDFFLVYIPHHINGELFSIRKCYELFCDKTYGTYHERWFLDYSFATETGDSCWIWARKNPVSDSFSKTWSEQQELISEGESVPTARVQFIASLMLEKKSGERMNEACLCPH